LSTCTISDWPSKIWRSIGSAASAPGKAAPALAEALAAGLSLPAARVDVGHQVGHMQEGGAIQADVDEGRLHAGQHTRDLAEVDIADQAALERALDQHVLHRALLDHGDPGLLRRPVDEYVLCHRGCAF
jgi:hypothetical protein